MNSTEDDFIDFVSTTQSEPIEAVRDRYLAAKTYLDFGSKEYSHLEDTNCHTLQMFFHDQSEKSLFASYKYYAYGDLLRMLSYTFPKTATSRGYLRTLVKALVEGDYRKIVSFLKRKTAITGERRKSEAELILGNHISPTILDYGCGIALLSFEMAQKSPGSKVILVDLDTIKLDFAEFRFKKHGVPYEVIRIQEDNQYPVLPVHTICIATDVLEHLQNPILAYEHIRDSMERDGILYGNFENHRHKMYHVHPDMQDVREAVLKDYDDLGDGLYKKR